MRRAVGVNDGATDGLGARDIEKRPTQGFMKSRAFALFYFAEALLVGRWMRTRSLSHLHVHFGGPVATVGMLTAKAWQIPWSLTLHGPDEFFDQEVYNGRAILEL